MQVNIEGMTVAIGMPVDNPIPHRTVMSLCETIKRCGELHVFVDLIMVCCGIVQMGRDQVLDEFLNGRAKNAKKLFWIDSDTVWHPDDFLRMLALSTQVDVVGVTYPTKTEGPITFLANYTAPVELSPLGLIPAIGMGLGYTIVDRAVCETLAAKAPRVVDSLSGREMAEVFRVDTFIGKDGRRERRTEDMAFFADVADAGFTVWLDPSIELGHIGEREWRGRLLDAFQRQS